MDISTDLNMILLSAVSEANKRGHEYIMPEHILYASLFNNKGSVILKNCGINVEALKKDLESFFDNPQIPHRVQGPPSESIGFRSVMNRAFLHSQTSSSDIVDIGDIYVSMYDEKNSFAVHFLEKQGVNRLDILNYISHGISMMPSDNDDSDSLSPKDLEELENWEDSLDEAGEDEEQQEKTADGKKKKYLEKYTTELVEKARRGEIDPLIGRADTIERTLHVLSRRFKNNPIFVGDPGVGKTAIVEGLARMISSGDVPEHMKDMKIFSLDMGSLLAGTRFRGDFEERLKHVLAELKVIENSVLFIDEIHTIVGAGAVQGGALDASHILKPVLTSGKMKCIGTSTYEEYKKYFEQDRALSRRFQKIEISEPTPEEAFEILKGIKKYYEDFHRVSYTDEALHAAAELSARFIQDLHLPDKAIDVIDEAGAFAKLRTGKTGGRKPKINIAEIERIVSKISKVPEKSISSGETVQLKSLLADLKSQVFGQDDAVGKVVEAIKRSRAGFREPNKPVASFLFVGPTGVGKTELARQLALNLGIPLHRFDMSEYQEKHTVARLIGAPPGYVGFDQGGLLTDSIRKHPYSVLLFDEIEKAHPDIYNTLLQVMDYATLTDNQGRKANFQNVIIIMTSNAGARDIEKPTMGFGDKKAASDSVSVPGSNPKEVEKVFSPEFRNRLDGIVAFRKLPMDVIKMIVTKQIDDFRVQLHDKKVELILESGCIEWLAAKGDSDTFGAREIARLIQDKVKSYFIDEVLFGKLTKGGVATAKIVNDDLVIESAKKKK
ncbi:MAG: ATP-dependent Clp protease ATP-binding subunit ClpA [Spirochaetes bacterium GWF1_51_8]|nr:MAG: ATP-dependent Clp protease ATP-binding subunit ClpA [Spirochaetes bacterium GWF1_51_8]